MKLSKELQAILL